MEEQKKPTLWNRFKAIIIDHHNHTLLGVSLRDSTQQEWEDIHKIAFERAKKLSDFIGMLTRLGFVFLAYRIFGETSLKADFWPTNMALGICATFTLALYLVMIFRVNVLVSMYFLSDTAHWKSRTHKIVITILSASLVAITAFGISSLVSHFADASLSK